MKHQWKKVKSKLNSLIKHKKCRRCKLNVTYKTDLAKKFGIKEVTYYFKRGYLDIVRDNITQDNCSGIPKIMYTEHIYDENRLQDIQEKLYQVMNYFDASVNYEMCFHNLAYIKGSLSCIMYTTKNLEQEVNKRGFNIDKPLRESNAFFIIPYVTNKVKITKETIKVLEEAYYNILEITPYKSKIKKCCHPTITIPSSPNTKCPICLQKVLK